MKKRALLGVVLLFVISTVLVRAQGPFGSSVGLQQLMQQVFADTQEIKAAMFTKVILFRIDSVPSGGAQDDNTLSCTADRDIMVHATLHTSGTGGSLVVTRNFAGGSVVSNVLSIKETVGLTFGANSGDELILRVSSPGPPDFVFGMVTVQAPAGGTVACSVSS